MGDWRQSPQQGSCGKQVVFLPSAHEMKGATCWVTWLKYQLHDKNLEIYAARLLLSVKQAGEDRRWSVWEKKKDKGVRSTCGELKNEQVSGVNSVNPQEVMGAAGRSVAFPCGRLRRIHTMKDRNMAPVHFFSPNYQTPYWLSSGREEVISFLSPFGKLIHFTKVTW